MAAVRMHDLREGVILAHEATIPASVEDRLALLRHVRTDLSPVFGLHDDPRGEVAAALSGAFGRDPVAEATTDDGTRQRLWRIEEPGGHRARCRRRSPTGASSSPTVTTATRRRSPTATSSTA